MTQAQIAQLVAAFLAANGSPKASKKTFKKSAKVADTGSDRLATIAAKFKRRGFSVTLRDANDPSKPFDVRPFGRAAYTDSDGNAVPASGWLGQGRVVRKGQKGVMGLFHITQTDPLPTS